MVTLATAERNGLGATPTVAQFNNFKNYSIMATVKFSTSKSETAIKFSTNKSDALFLTFAVAVERSTSEIAIRFAFWHGVFNIKISREPKITA